MKNQGKKPKILVIAPPLSRDPVSWVHRVEAWMLARELLAMGYEATVIVYENPQTLNSSDGINLLRLSDALMVKATRELTSAGIKYAGPSPGALEESFDKLFADGQVEKFGVFCPSTFTAVDSSALEPPLLLKPRHGSDSLGIRICRDGKIPKSRRTSEYLVQPFILGADVTVAVLKGKVGTPLQVMRPERKLYSFFRKNLMKTKKTELDDPDLSNRIQELAAQVAEIFAIDWAARVDFLYEKGSGRIYFLECDAAPTIGSSSSFAESLRRMGVTREEQIALIVGDSRASRSRP